MSKLRLFPQSVPGKTAPLRFDILGVVVSRGVMFAVLFWVTLRFEGQSLIRGMVVVYAVSTILYLGTWLTLYRMAKASPIGFLFYFQFIIEIGVIASIFLLSDGYHSDYSLLFILTILSAGLFFQYAGAMVMASLAGLVFAYAGALHLGILALPDLSLSPLTVEALQIRFFLNVTLYFMVALLSAQLSQRLKAMAGELAGTHEALDLFRFSAGSMMDALPLGLLYFDSDGRLAFFNAGCPKLLGRELAMEDSLDSVFSGLLPPDILEGLASRTRDGTEDELEKVSLLEINSVPGKVLRMQTKSLTRKDTRLGLICILLDFTHEKGMERALLRSERMAALGEMSARIAHEIRNPLSSVSGSAQMLLENPSMEESDSRLLRLIVTESARLNRTLTALLNFAKEKVPSYRKVSMAALWKKVRMVLEKNPNFNKDLVSIRVLIENDDIEFSSDQDVLFQVLLNVAINGLQALENGSGTLEFLTRESDDRVLIEIRDNGRGMDEQGLKRAFEPFFTTKPDGTGLGLATSLHYVQSLDGEMEIESEPGRGTSVSIYLPKKA